ncbi:MAG TPA: hypothetical protein VH880_01130 [Anaeromyxobacteraceae bacterium]|jgi:uncharacterized membrane protein
MIREVVKGAVVAAAVCSMFAAGAARAGEKAEKTKEGAKVVHCGGINSCKGQGSCAGADNSCKAQNSCKGMGWIETKSEKECKDKGGKVVAAKM